jgi:hypothetical protein
MINTKSIIAVSIMVAPRRFGGRHKRRTREPLTRTATTEELWQENADMVGPFNE